MNIFINVTVIVACIVMFVMYSSTSVIWWLCAGGTLTVIYVLYWAVKVGIVGSFFEGIADIFSALD